MLPKGPGRKMQNGLKITLEADSFLATLLPQNLR